MRNIQELLLATGIGAVTGEVAFQATRLGVQFLESAHIVSTRAPEVNDPAQLLWVGAGALALIIGYQSDFARGLLD